MKKMIIILYFGIFIILSACNNKEKQIEEITISSIDCIDDTSLYFIYTFYSNGKPWKNGAIKGERKNQDWNEYYIDGTLKNKISYSNGRISYENKHPKITYEDDSLKVGVMTKIRILDLYPGDLVEFSENLSVTNFEDKSEYDYGITPLNDDTVYFYYIEKRGKEISESKLFGKSPVYK